MTNHEQQLIFTNSVAQAIDAAVASLLPSSLFIVTDTNVARLVLPKLVAESERLAAAKVIVTEPGDTNKNVLSLQAIWQALVEGGANRRSVVVNLGGGVVTDMGGFAAATFKRGIRFINVPTTLLSAVDAAVGGKTGINFLGLKNEIGSFCNADAVIISTRFFDTLPQAELLSGFAEMLKHSLLAGPDQFNALLSFDILNSASHPDLSLITHHSSLLSLLEESVMVKKRIVTADPTEQGLRKALNLGHTPGHAFESWAMASGHPVPHGYAVAWGLVVDLVLSVIQLGFPSADLQRLASFVRTHYGAIGITCNDYPALIDFMRHDKKNTDGTSIRFTLLTAPGEVELDATATPEQITAALDIFRDLMGC